MQQNSMLNSLYNFWDSAAFNISLVHMILIIAHVACSLSSREYVAEY